MKNKQQCDANDFQVTENFNYLELIDSKTASARGINNIPPEEFKKNLIDSCSNLWQPARDILGVPMKINSGYRSPVLNKAIGGSTTSTHCYGYAIDFVAPKFGTTTEIVKTLVSEFTKRGIAWDQIILEFPSSPNSWVHLGWKHNSGKQRKQILTAVKDKQGKTIYLPGIRV